ncbi:MFS transporter [Chitinophaga pollutisoli]|uniref:MFS transporter n=1 Tax=Chitinophaga pollutisoli TaxID=3133966 RepID=A0ABZ2YUJ8_9BACT
MVPGGIVIGSLVSLGMTNLNLGWEAQIWIILLPTLVYAWLFYGQEFPKPHHKESISVVENLKAMATPLFIFIAACMTLTAISEFGPQQWTGIIMASSGAEPMVILALVTGLMAVGRYFGGGIVGKFDQTGVLLGSAIFTTIGIYLFSTVTGGMVYVAAILFAVGVCYFWPNMIGFVAEKIPKSGAFGMSVVGAFGMFSTSMWNPVIGGWIDEGRVRAAANGLSGAELELAAGQETMKYMIIFPAVLIVLFTLLWFWVKRSKPAAKSAAQPAAHH